MLAKSACASLNSAHMALLVDIGNTHIKWCDSADLADIGPSIGLSSNLREVLSQQWSRLDMPSAVMVSNVAGRETETILSTWMIETWNMQPTYVKVRHEQLGVVNGYRKPVQLGVDRWMALIAARALFQQVLIVVDCGTATTIDAMDDTGLHYGGIILPGYQMMQESMLGNTAIPDYTNAVQKTLFATDTASGIRSGAVIATAGAVEKIVGAMRNRAKGEVICLVTGGGAEELIGVTDISVRHEPHLVLNGLDQIARQANQS